MSALRAWARKLLGDYELFRIYSIDAETAIRVSPDVPPEFRMERLEDPGELERSSYPEIRSLAQYHADESVCVVARSAGKIVSACHFWAGETYRKRNFWPLEAEEAKLVQITTAEAFRGRGIAKALLAHASRTMVSQGYRRLYARIWHSNRPSLRAFEQAGWRYIAFVGECRPLGMGRRRRFVWRK